MKHNSSSKTEPVLSEADLRTEKALSAKEVDRRLFTLARAHRRVESTLSYYLKEVEERQLYLQYGFAKTVDYARERLGFEVLDLMCAEVLCTYALTPPFGDGGDEEEPAGGFARSIAERDGWICTKPGCTNRSALTGNHIVPRGRGGGDEDWNKHLVCTACHLAITEGRLKVSGRAPDGLSWEGPFGVIEKPLPLSPEIQKGKGEPLVAREPKAAYGTKRQRDENNLEPFDARLTDHVISPSDVRVTQGANSLAHKILPNSVIGYDVMEFRRSLSISGTSVPLTGVRVDSRISCT